MGEDGKENRTYPRRRQEYEKMGDAYKGIGETVKAEEEFIRDVELNN